MRIMSAHVPRLRVSLLGLIIVALFAVLTVRLYDLQVVTTLDYQVQAEANRTRLVEVLAPRGRILDRNGKVIVDNRITSVVSLDRNAFGDLSEEERNEILLRLVYELNEDGNDITAEQILNRLRDRRFSPYVPVPIATDVSEELRIYLAERSNEFPAVRAERAALREYPYGRLASNLLGYVGSINETELEEREDEQEKPYSLNDQIGKAGLELSYEEHLRGTPGMREIEVDAEGNPVRIIDEQLPRPGSDIYLTVDIDLQALAQQRLEQGLEEARQRPPRGGRPPNRGTRGAVVVEDPSNGQVLAMASYPTYDPRDFVDGISAEQWAELNDPANHYPLNNWAIQGTWAPGSSFKLFTAYAGLAGGIIGPDTAFSDGGAYHCGTGCSISNYGGTAMGSITLYDALRRSSNVYFANIGGEFWHQRGQRGGEEAMQQWMKALGVGEPTGIPLSYEAAGRAPSAVWVQDYCEQVGRGDDPDCSYWAAGHNAFAAIGQGDVLVTPLHLANGYATVANGGTRYQPQIVDRIETPDGEVDPVGAVEVDKIHMPPEIREPINQGLIGVTQGGTASGAFSGFPHEEFPVAGKTGTGEFDHKANTATFVAYGPAHAPQYVISVVMEESDVGGVAAAPVSRALFDVLAGVEPMPPAPLGGDLEPADDLVTVEGQVGD